MEDVNWLFIDMNSYFASVEQQERAELRGKPIVIIPIEAEAGCCIAVSYQAKAYGIRTGCRLEEARKLCPHIEVVIARPRRYVEYHEQIVKAITRCVPVTRVLSCDEFACRLVGRERDPVRAMELACAIKEEIRTVGTTLRCSIGAAPNRYLAKVAGEMQRPDGLMLLTKRDLPASLYALGLHELPGVGSRMEKRVRAAGITTVRELCALTRQQMSNLWGGVLGDRTWLWLRGEDFEELQTGPPQSLSRQHILPPDCRTLDKARGITVKLLHSTARRMRTQGLWAASVGMHVGFQDGRAWQVGVHVPPTQNLFKLQTQLLLLWKHAPCLTPSDVTVVLSDLQSTPQTDLFEAADDAGPAERITRTVDKLNLRYGLHKVYPGAIHAVRTQAPTRISFGAPPPLEEFNDPADRHR